MLLFVQSAPSKTLEWIGSKVVREIQRNSALIAQRRPWDKSSLRAPEITPMPPQGHEEN